jgi:hypothetical protein
MDPTRRGRSISAGNPEASRCALRPLAFARSNWKELEIGGERRPHGADEINHIYM